MDVLLRCGRMWFTVCRRRLLICILAKHHYKIKQASTIRNLFYSNSRELVEAESLCCNISILLNRVYTYEYECSGSASLTRITLHVTTPQSLGDELTSLTSAVTCWRMQRNECVSCTMCSHSDRWVPARTSQLP